MTPQDPQRPPEPVATGDRRDEVRLEPDPDQLVRLRATFKPDESLPPEEQSAASEAGAGRSAAPPVEDVGVVPADSSVWDARPTDADPAGGPSKGD